jgi:ArsR family transcriptional regulator, virulence genes transcriptional regulator
MKKQKFDLNKKQLDLLIKGIQGLAHPVRFMILYTLLKEESSVNDLSLYTGASQSVTSQHLSKMKDSGILDSRKESNKVFYFIKDGNYRELLKVLLKIHSEMEAGSKRK